MSTVSKDPLTGRKNITDTAEQLTLTDVLADFGIQIKADVSNSEEVFVGPANVTAGSAFATDGFPLGSGEGIFIPTRHPSGVFCVAPASGQKVFWMIM